MTRAVELDLIRGDARFYFDFLSLLLGQRSFSILNYGFIPYWSLFVIETHQYFQKNIAAYADALLIKNEKIITSSRMRVKFFDDSDKRIEGMLDLFKWIVNFHAEWHINKHKGCLAPLQRWLQTDLGLYGYENHIIGSTHTGILNLGYEKQNLPEKVMIFR